MRALLALVLTGCFGSDEPRPQKLTPQRTATAPVAKDTGPAEAPNRPPKVERVQIEPKRATTNDTLTATAMARDPDQDDVDLDFVWIKNGKEQHHLRSSTLRSSEFQKGDKISVMAVASDGIEKAQAQGPTITISNTPPTWVEDPRNVKNLDGFRVRARDDDDDEITYSLNGEPRGMTIHPKDGVIRYAGAADEPGGDYTISVIAQDDDGGRVNWKVGVSISAGSQAKGD